MKDQFLKLAGVKSDKEFYKLFPDEKSFMAKYGKQVKKLNLGGAMQSLNKLAASNPVAVGVQSAGDIIGGIKQIKDDRQMMFGAQQMQGVSNVALQASLTRPEEIQRKYLRPDDPSNMAQPDQLYNSIGSGTNILSAKNGTEIANTFAPNTIYTNLEQAWGGLQLPKSNPDFMKFNKSGEQTDLFNFAEQGGGDYLNQMTAGLGNPKGYDTSGVGKVAGGVGSIAGTLLGGPVGGMIGKFAGRKLGDLLDRKAENTEEAREATQKDIDTIKFNQNSRALQQQNNSHMKNGGIMNPQVINNFGGIPINQLLKKNLEMDTLRIGGNIRQENMAMGGDLKTHWGGYAEPMSINPYLPNGGETVMFRGKSHEESDGKGNTGIGITYGDSPVEVERGEPALQLKNGSDGSNNLTVYGNLKIPNYGVDIIGDPKAKGKKFKNYVSDLTRIENSQNKLMNKSTKGIESINESDPYDKLSLASYKSNVLGANMKLKDIAEKKINAANLQSAINDTAEEYQLVADDLAKGKVKVDKKAKAEQARFGKSILKAQDGVKELTVPDSLDMPTFDVDREAGLAEALESYKNKKFVDKYPEIKSRNNDGIITAINQLYPFLRPSDAEAIDPNQLSGEMFALASNQEDGVPVQTFQPELAQYMNVSLQDQINAVTAQTRAAQRMAQNNPAALAMINAQAYDAINSIKANEFRMNQQEMKGTLYENRQAINQARLQNIANYTQQSEKQLQGKALTKAVKQAALNSIASKYAQNKLENRTLATYENMYNFRFDDKGRAINMNPLQQFNTDVMGNITLAQLEEEVDKRKKDQKEKEKETGFGRNGAILKAFRS